MNKKSPKPPAHKAPKYLQQAIASSPSALAAWKNITPLSRNEWICWVISVKKPETRTLHINRMLSDLSTGKKRPCCWPGCSHRNNKKHPAT